MLARDEKGETPWAVLVDSEKYRISQSEIDEEKPSRTLPARLRNTIAHELVHSLPFRVREFGIKLKQPPDSLASQKELVLKLENQIESLSPLLLLPERSLTQGLSALKHAMSLQDARAMRKLHGVSRQVFVNRLSMLSFVGENRRRIGLNNVGIGVGEWKSDQEPVLRKWPLFVNFEKNLRPSFLHTSTKQDYAPARGLFPPGIFDHGPPHTAEMECKGGTATLPDSEPMRVRVEVEPRAGSGGSFLFLVQRLK
jgi:hypothetical protein